MMLDTLTAADLHFSPALHEYSLPDGRLVPSVTQILGAVGVSVDFDALGMRSERLRGQIETAGQLGTAVHADCHAYDDADIDWPTVDPRVEPYVRAWATCRQQTGLVPLTRERRVFHPSAFFCGTLDGVFLLQDGTHILVDLKTGDPESSACRYQTAAYAEAFQLEHPHRAIQVRWAVQLTPECTVPYRITPYTDWRDFRTFQAFCTTYHHQADRRLRS